MGKRKKHAKDEGTAPAVARVDVVTKDIDEIFAKKAPSKPAVTIPVQTALKTSSTVGAGLAAVVTEDLADIDRKIKAAKPAKSFVTRSVNDNDDFADIRGIKKRIILSSKLTRVGKRTSDGLTLYQEDELRIGQGGDTPLCPFDCDCCINLNVKKMLSSGF